MNKKTVGIFIVTLLIGTAVIPVMGTMNFDKTSGCYKPGMLLDDDELDQSQTNTEGHGLSTSWYEPILLQSFKPTKPILTRIQLYLQLLIISFLLLNWFMYH